MTLSNRTQMHFEKYLSSNPSTFMVTVDGRNSYYRYCPDTACRTEPVTAGLYNCEKFYGKECRIYAVKDKVVWQFDDQYQPIEETLKNAKSAKLDMDWSGVLDGHPTQMHFDKGLEGKLTLISDETGECKGDFSLNEKPGSTRYPGDWRLECAKGQKAKGKLTLTTTRSGEIQFINASGKDRDDTYVRMYLSY
ncbi:hypothetical protein [Aestuariispira insulae]|nr:hypothetical protein [Aestuariispira insulae]